MVVVFCGRVLPLDTDIMETGLLEEKKAHLLAVLNEFLDERLDKLFAEQELQAAKDALAEQATEIGEPADPAEIETVAPAAPAPQGKRPISETEFSDFVNVDLKLLDNKDYFKAVFE
ncbi:MAG: hypothetical protein IT368_04985 [Candidatus Hydrogenedentes bacterium]|nr:hypothetical protein [Candidatus Hydrogenedentota bacterium]